jgi:UDP-N-acetylmuramyl pentapeptide synthase
MGSRADFRASNYRAEFTGTSYQLDARGKSYLVRLPLIGRFNVTNSIAALAAAEVLGINLRSAVLSLGKAPQVPDAWNWFLRNDNFKCSWITHTLPMRSPTF